MSLTDVENKVVADAKVFWAWQNGHRHLMLVLVGVVGTLLILKFVFHAL